MKQIIRCSSDPGDVIWEPFGGLCSATIAGTTLDRKCFAAEINCDMYKHALNRLKNLHENL